MVDPPLKIEITAELFAPVIENVVKKVLGQQRQFDHLQHSLLDQLLYAETQAAKALGLSPIVLKEERLRGRIEFLRRGRQVRYQWFTEVYGEKRKDAWSRYATDLYARLREKARLKGWIGKLRYLLYESDISEVDAPEFESLEGVLLQSKPAEDGLSRNPHISRYQTLDRRMEEQPAVAAGK